MRAIQSDMQKHGDAARLIDGSLDFSFLIEEEIMFIHSMKHGTNLHLFSAMKVINIRMQLHWTLCGGKVI